MTSLAALEDSLHKRNQELESKASSTLASIRATIQQIEQGVVDVPLEPRLSNGAPPVAGSALTTKSSTGRRSASGRTSLHTGKSRSASLGKEQALALDEGAAHAILQPEAASRLQQAKLKALEQELTAVRQQCEEQKEELDATKTQLKALKQEKAAWSKTEKALLLQVEKIQRQQEQAEATAAAQQQQSKEVLQEGARAAEDRRNAQVEVRSKNVQLNQALEEVKRYKVLLQEFKQKERDGKDVARSDYNRLLADKKRLERQRAELLTAFKKQLKLIDVLKRQKIHMEAARALAFTEEEFMKTLDIGSV